MYLCILQDQALQKKRCLEAVLYVSEVENLFQVSNFTADQGPVVQSVVSLTSSLRVISLTVLADSIYNILIFFAEKM